jgi:drug/metabolite transporter superfamily protein YnfA
MSLLLLGSVLIAPVPTTLLARAATPSRLLWIAPLVALLAVYGAIHLIASPSRPGRAVGYAAVAAMPIALAIAWLW